MRVVWHKYYEKTMALLLLGGLFVGFISLIALASGAVMRIFGFQYQSVGSVILFFILAAMVSYPINLVAEVFPKVLLYREKVSRGVAILLYLILDTMATALGLKFVDYFMPSVSATNVSIVAISILLALMGIRDIDKKPKGME